MKTVWIVDGESLERKNHLVLFWQDGVIYQEGYIFTEEGSPFAPFSTLPIAQTGLDFRFFLIT